MPGVIESRQGARKAFSTEEARTKYIEENKPCLSLSDIVSMDIAADEDEDIIVNYKKLKELVKTIINNK